MVTSTDVTTLDSPMSGRTHALPAGSAKRHISKSPKFISLQLRDVKDFSEMYFLSCFSIKYPTPIFPVWINLIPSVVICSDSIQSPSLKYSFLPSASLNRVTTSHSPLNPGSLLFPLSSSCMAPCLICFFLEIRASREEMRASTSERAVAMACCSGRGGSGICTFLTCRRLICGYAWPVVMEPKYTRIAG